MSYATVESPTPAGLPSGHIFRLGDGRRLGYEVFGDRTGSPVFLHHGLPGSRLPTGSEESMAAAGGFRLITVDRPGFGLSSFQPGRSLGDWPLDLSRLADHLGVDRLSVLGVSAGGAYALACGVMLQERLDRIVLVNSMAPLDLPGVARCFDPSRRFGYWLIGHVPGQSRWVAWLQARAVRQDPAVLLRRIASRMSDSDREALSDQATWSAILPHLAEAYREGPAGVAHELQLMARPWGIRLDKITSTVDMFHGALDRNVPIGAAHLLAEALPACRTTFFEGEGHLSSPGAQARIVDALRPI